MTWLFRFRRRRKSSAPAKPPVRTGEEARDFTCKYCGPVHGVPVEHVDSPEHKQAQAQALSPMARRAEIDAMRDLNG